jgi:hypothetical protein
MKKKISKKYKTALRFRDNGKHNFLFWLIVPLVMVWLSVGYIMGIVGDKPIWFNNQNLSQKTNEIIPYIQEYGGFSENLNQPFVTFWFDDAWLSQYMEAYPILKSNNFPAAIAVPVNAVETPNYVNWAQLKVMQANGWEITDHSVVHDCTMQKWSEDKISYEYKTSKFILWKNGLSADIFVTPCGVDSSIMRQEASKMFMSYRTVDPGFNNPSNFNLYNLKVKNVDSSVSVSTIKGWLDYAKQSNSWVILVFHKVGDKSSGIGDERFSTSKKDFETIVNYVKALNIKVVTPSQIMASQSNI